MAGMEMGTDRPEQSPDRRQRSTRQPEQTQRDVPIGSDKAQYSNSLNGRPASHRRDGSHDARVRYGRAYRVRFVKLPEQHIATALLDALVIPRMRFEGDCWIATGRANTGGYPQVYVERKNYLVHRLAFHAFVRPLGAGELVLHRCDVRRCFNPAHLFVGDHEANAVDMAVKGRAAARRYSEETIRAVLADTGTLKEIAARHGISKTHAGYIRQRRTWRHLA